MTHRWLDALPALAEQHLPVAVWQYFAAGARDGVTTDEAVGAWAAFRFAPHVLRDVTEVDTTARLLGTDFRLPFGIAPTSMQRAAHPEGERAMERAAARAGVPHVVSSNAGFRFAEISEAGGRPWWIQAYLTADRYEAAAMLGAAADAGADAVVLTADTPVVGTKYAPAEADWEGIDLSWHRCNYPVPPRGGWARDLGVEDIGWLRDLTGLPVVVKGVLRADDARRCVAAGAAAVWVSNHGGRQLDRALSTAAALPAVVGAVAGECEVYVDGGVRGGLDVLTALALGARGVFLGRLPLYALASGGTDGVTRMLAELETELVEAMRLCGAPDLAQTRGLVAPGNLGHYLTRAPDTSSAACPDL